MPAPNDYINNNKKKNPFNIVVVIIYSFKYGQRPVPVFLCKHNVSPQLC